MTEENNKSTSKNNKSNKSKSIKKNKSIKQKNSSTSKDSNNSTITSTQINSTNSSSNSNSKVSDLNPTNNSSISMKLSSSTTQAHVPLASKKFISEETKRMTMSASLTDINVYFEKHPIEARHWCRDIVLVREWLIQTAIPNKFKLQEANFLKEMLLSEHDTLFEVIFGKYQWNWSIRTDSSNSNALLSQLDLLFQENRRSSKEGISVLSPTNSNFSKSNNSTQIGTNTININNANTTNMNSISNTTSNKHGVKYGIKDEKTIKEVLSYLIEQLDLQLNVKRYSSNGRTLLHYVICNSDEHFTTSMKIECCKYLLKRGSIPLQDTRDQENPVHSISHLIMNASDSSCHLEENEQKRLIELLEMLIESRPEALLETSLDGNSPLHIICKSISENNKYLSFHHKIIELMLEYITDFRSKKDFLESCIQLLKCDKTKKEIQTKYPILDSMDQGVLFMDDITFETCAQVSHTISSKRQLSIDDFF